MLDNTSYINASLQMQFFFRCWPNNVILSLSRMSFWLNWRSWNRRSWTRTCWKLVTQRMSLCPVCLQTHYPRNLLVRFMLFSTYQYNSNTDFFFISHKLLSKFYIWDNTCEIRLKKWITLVERCLESFPCGNPYNHFPLCFSSPKKERRGGWGWHGRTQGMGHVNLPNLPDSRCSSWLAWAGKPEKLQRVNTTKQFLRYLLQSGKNNLQWKWIWSRLIWQ